MSEGRLRTDLTLTLNLVQRTTLSFNEEPRSDYEKGFSRVILYVFVLPGKRTYPLGQLDDGYSMCETPQTDLVGLCVGPEVFTNNLLNTQRVTKGCRG